jgi:hypothetical protein
LARNCLLKHVIERKVEGRIEIKKNEMGGTRGTYGRQERSMKCFGGETCGKDATWKT